MNKFTSPDVMNRADATASRLISPLASQSALRWRCVCKVHASKSDDDMHASALQVSFEQDIIISQANEYEVLQLLLGECRERLMAYEGERMYYFSVMLSIRPAMK
jgi:hypothetical protein